nr:MAG TPA: FMRFamide related peptide family [Caudoviricetes sp.]
MPNSFALYQIVLLRHCCLYIYNSFMRFGRHRTKSRPLLCFFAL